MNVRGVCVAIVANSFNPVLSRVFNNIAIWFEEFSEKIFRIVNCTPGFVISKTNE